MSGVSHGPDHSEDDEVQNINPETDEGALTLTTDNLAEHMATFGDAMGDVPYMASDSEHSSDYGSSSDERIERELRAQFAMNHMAGAGAERRRSSLRKKEREISMSEADIRRIERLTREHQGGQAVAMAVEDMTEQQIAALRFEERFSLMKQVVQILQPGCSETLLDKAYVTQFSLVEEYPDEPGFFEAPTLHISTDCRHHLHLSCLILCRGGGPKSGGDA
jgi:hypothetical protein